MQLRQAIDHFSEWLNITRDDTNMQLLPSDCRWAASNGIKTLLQPALFDGGIRGLAATTDLPAGAQTVRVPQAALISHETAKNSDLVGSSHMTLNVALTASHKGWYLCCTQTAWSHSHTSGQSHSLRRRQVTRVHIHKPCFDGNRMAIMEAMVVRVYRYPAPQAGYMQCSPQDRQCHIDKHWHILYTTTLNGPG